MARADVNGTEIFYVEVGSGLPCLVMHGGLGVDHGQFREWLDPLGDVLHLVYYDHRGNGRSGRPPIDTLTHEQLSADADALRAQLGFERVAVLGHSYGGCLALEYALRYPQHVSCLLLVGTTAAWDYLPALGTDLQRRAVGNAVTTAFVSLPETDEQMARNQLAIAPLAFRPRNVHLAERVLGRTRWNAAANRRSRKLAVSFNVTERLPDITVPTVILSGRDDFFCPRPRKPSACTVASGERNW